MFKKAPKYIIYFLNNHITTREYKKKEKTGRIKDNDIMNKLWDDFLRAVALVLIRFFSSINLLRRLYHDLFALKALSHYPVFVIRLKPNQLSI